MSCFGKETRPFPRFFSLVGGCSSDGYGNQDVTKFGDETYVPVDGVRFNGFFVCQRVHERRI